MFVRGENKNLRDEGINLEATEGADCAGVGWQSGGSGFFPGLHLPTSWSILEPESEPQITANGSTSGCEYV